jgi:hypothetical protein
MANNPKQGGECDFLDAVNLSKDQHEKVIHTSNSKEMRILLFSEVQKIFQGKQPANTEEAAAKYYEAKGLMNLIPNIQKPAK